MYNAVVIKHVNEIVIRRSRFITTLLTIKDIADFELKLANIRKTYSNATHNCYACILNETATMLKFGDDGEPQGTAGMPMLEVLKKRNIYKTLAVVTRYFGGIKLGAGGLVSAYADSVSLALERADIRIFKYSCICEVTVGYTLEKYAADLICRYGKVVDKQYYDNVKLRFAVPQENFDDLTIGVNDLSCGQNKVTLIGKEYIDY